MKKVIFSIVVCFITYMSSAQDLKQLDQNKLNDQQFVASQNLEDFSRLATNAKVGVAYIESNGIKKYNTERGIKLIRIKGEDFQKLSSNTDFNNSVEMIIINISKPGFSISEADCNILNRFPNLKYVYFKYQTNLYSRGKLNKFNCTANKVKQYYSIQLPS